ncbi:MAG: hypothetical protein O4861_16185 [Trichodesmium sp. St16_bin4-tuft]|nr:hypothetical protein [Trichodesmium sp. St2_bin6]MDE5095638.1 hypothetical protein [Trichodesmium sp. St11_bin5]MDE5099786.1 hypothetical protein [Trichodesmium sp. St16_bin4-tuft]MDT9339418.1 hypothetical protein [Trichodesmium erythraeum 21-75]
MHKRVFVKNQERLEAVAMIMIVFVSLLSSTKKVKKRISLPEIMASEIKSRKPQRNRQ